MPLYTKTMRQCMVEFISDSTIGGVYTDGVRNATSTNGPWTWVVPSGVTLVKVDMIAGGCGGGAGWNTGTAQAGGGGGTSGPSIQGMDLHVIPGASLTITVGAGGSGAVSGGAAATAGGRTTISGLTRPFWWRRATFSSGSTNTVESGLAYGGGGSSATATASGSGSYIGNNILGYGGAAINNGTSGLTGGSYSWGSQPGDTTNIGSTMWAYYGGRFWAQGAAAGGAAHTTPSSPGGNGGGFTNGGDLYNSLFAELGVNLGQGDGDTTTSISRGGGGSGSHSFLAFGGKGGNGGVAGANGSFGSGGGGGGGGANGGSGGNGYVRILYWTTN